MAAVGATHPGKTFFEIPALEECGHGPLDDRTPEAVLGLKMLIVVLLERVEMLINQTPQVGCTRIAWLVQ